MRNTHLGVTIEQEDLDHTLTFGEFCALVRGKIAAEPAEDCTHQQAFYKLRTTIAKATGMPASAIGPGTRFRDIVPIHRRKALARALDAELGFSSGLLTAPAFWSVLAALSVFAGLIGLVVCFPIGLLLFAVGLLNFWIMSHFEIVFRAKTVGAFTRVLTQEAYRLVRRNPRSYNPREIEPLLRQLLADLTGFPPSAILDDTRL